jgi:hypothetical protein
MCYSTLDLYRLAGLISQINGIIDEVLVVPGNSITSRQLGKLLQVKNWNGQNTLVAMKQQFGSLRSYLERQHVMYALAFPEEIAPDFIVRLRDDSDDSDDGTDGYTDRDSDREGEDGDEEVEEEGVEDDVKPPPTTGMKKSFYTDQLSDDDEDDDDEHSVNYNDRVEGEYTMTDKMRTNNLNNKINDLGKNIEMEKEDVGERLHARADHETSDINQLEPEELRIIYRKAASALTVDKIKRKLILLGQRVTGVKEVLTLRLIEAQMYYHKYIHLVRKLRDNMGNGEIASKKYSNGKEIEYGRDSVDPIRSLIIETHDRRENHDFLISETIAEISRVENIVENEDGDRSEADKQKINMIINLITSLQFRSDEMDRADELFENEEVENKIMKQNRKRNENRKKNVLEQSSQSTSQITITKSGNSVKNYPTSTSTIIPSIRGSEDMSDDKKIMDIIVGLLRESDDLKVSECASVSVWVREGRREGESE